jgi:hypothetical protein
VTRRLTAGVTETPNPNIRSGEFYSDHFGDYYPDLDRREGHGEIGAGALWEDIGDVK